MPVRVGNRSVDYVRLKSLCYNLYHAVSVCLWQASWDTGFIHCFIVTLVTPQTSICQLRLCVVVSWLPFFNLSISAPVTSSLLPSLFALFVNASTKMKVTCNRKWSLHNYCYDIDLKTFARFWLDFARFGISFFFSNSIYYPQFYNNKPPGGGIWFELWVSKILFILLVPETVKQSRKIMKRKD